MGRASGNTGSPAFHWLDWPNSVNSLTGIEFAVPMFLNRIEIPSYEAPDQFKFVGFQGIALQHTNIGPDCKAGSFGRQRPWIRVEPYSNVVTDASANRNPDNQGQAGVLALNVGKVVPRFGVVFKNGVYRIVHFFMDGPVANTMDICGKPLRIRDLPVPVSDQQVTICFYPSSKQIQITIRHVAFHHTDGGADRYGSNGFSSCFWTGVDLHPNIVLRTASRTDPNGKRQARPFGCEVCHFGKNIHLVSQVTIRFHSFRTTVPYFSIMAGCIFIYHTALT